MDTMNTTRAQQAKAIERWADQVDPADLVEANTAALRTIAELVEQRDDVDNALLDAIRNARDANRSWSEIGAMLGVSKQAAQRKYAAKLSA
ncbi:MAG: AsnC family transcriptional regulator [Acidimicrobiales bacterium]|nr:AsnC family transcriptional regulator [Acidimicrobiales bacterium]